MHFSRFMCVYLLTFSLSLSLQFNFVGKLLGPKGNSMKRLQEETMTKMAVLGRGSMRDKQKVREGNNVTFRRATECSQGREFAFSWRKMEGQLNDVFGDTFLPSADDVDDGQEGRKKGGEGRPTSSIRPFSPPPFSSVPSSFPSFSREDFLAGPSLPGPARSASIGTFVQKSVGCV